MAINSSGYLGNFTDTAWARSAPFHGYGRYSTQNVAALQFGINPDTAAARSVIVNPGRCYGDGILDEVTGSTLLSFPAVTTPTYGAIVMNRNWSTQTSTLRAVPGTSSLQIPPSTLKSDAGTESDQVLGLVGLTPGSAAISLLLDRRTWVEGPRTLPAYKTADVLSVPSGSASFIVGLSDEYARAGEYVISGAASLGASLVGGLSALSIRAHSYGALEQDIGGINVSIPTANVSMPISRPFTHVGGPLTASLFITTPSGFNFNIRTGSYLLATWVGPVV